MNVSSLLQNGKDEDLNNVVMQLRKATNHIQIFNRNSVSMPFVLKVVQKAICIRAEVEEEEEMSSITAPEDFLTLTLDGELVTGNKSKFKTNTVKPTI
jgi:hypothetical protein